MRLNRRRFLQAGAAGAAGAALLPAAGCSMDEAGSAEQMNVLLVIVDSLRPDHVGAYGSPQIQTPNIDALAARGLRFNRAFPEANVTIPARRSIFTSKRIFPYRNHVVNEELGTSTVNKWLPPALRDDRYVPGMRKYLANSGEVVDEEQTCAARVFKEAATML